MRPPFLIVAFSLAMVAVAAGAEQAPPSADTTSSATDSEPLAEVTVTARRIELEKRVSKYVYQIAALENEEGLPRWRRHICPQVSGLPREEGEFVLERISDAAREAGAPLAAENCGPNLFVVVTTDPKRILEGMNTTTRLLTFAGAHPSVIDAFIRTPRPVRVWYRTAMATPEGVPLGDTDRTNVSENVFGEYPVVAAETAYARRNVIWNLTRLLVVVDQRRLRGVSRGQFADYIAMVSLADLKPGAHLGDAPTILKLFDSAPEAAPAGMSQWDKAFLKSLYSSEQTSKGQRGQIAHTIVREIGR